VLVPIQFIAYATDISDTFSAHKLPYHMFADDTQLYDHCLISSIPILVDTFNACISDLQQSFATHLKYADGL